MSLTKDERYWLDKREELTDNGKHVVDEAFDAIFDSADAWEIPYAGGDRLGALYAALVRYIIESREGMNGAINVSLEPGEWHNQLAEQCVFCKQSTRYWHTGTNNPCCQPCANTHTVKDLEKNK